MNATSAAALETKALPSGASFLEVLAGAGPQSAQPTKEAAGTSNQLTPATDSSAGDASEKTDSKPGVDVENQVQVQGDNLQDIAVAVRGKTAAGQKAVASKSTPSNASSSPSQTRGVANSGAKAQTVAIAATINFVQPAVPPSPQPVVVLGAPVPSPTVQAPVEAQLEPGKRVSIDASAGVSGTIIDRQAPAGARIENKGEDNQQTPSRQIPSAKIAREAQSSDAGTASQGEETGPSLQAAPAAVTATAGSASTNLAPANVVLADFGPLPEIGGAPQQGGKAAPVKSSDTNLSKTVAPTNGQSSQKASQTQGTTISAAASSTTQGNGPLTQKTQADASQVAPVANKAADTGAAQIQVTVSQNAGHDAAGSHLRVETAVDTNRASERPMQTDAAESAPASGINTANVIQKMSETEMRVGMRSVDFGAISIRTSVSQQQMTAQISVDHSDLGKAISAHIPAMEAKICGELGLRALVEVSQSGMQFTGEQGSSSQRDQKPVAASAQSQSESTSMEADQPAWRESARSAVLVGSETRLDIRA
jgi:hypothetical protein